jgi:hypothetical protein
MSKEKEQTALTDEQIKVIVSQIASLTADQLVGALEEQKDNAEIVQLIEEEMEERSNGATRIPRVSEAYQQYGHTLI